MTDRLEDAITKLGADHEPPVGREARVLAAITPLRRGRWRAVLAFVVGALIGAAVAAAWMHADAERAADYAQRCREALPLGERYCLDNLGACR